MDLNTWQGYAEKTEDEHLVTLAVGGDRRALEALVREHQQWIYHIALRMTGSAQDAEDITQEILIKVLTRLSTFKGKSRFKTWLYRLVSNHVLSMGRKPMEALFSSMEKFDYIREHAENLEWPDQRQRPAETELLIEETKVKCTMGMVVCLNREERLIFILGGIIGVNSRWGAEVLNMSPDNYRQKLRRSRQHLVNYINDKCSLINPRAECRCSHKTRAAIDAGVVDPEHRVFYSEHLEKARALCEDDSGILSDIMDTRAEAMIRSQELQDGPDYSSFILKTLESRGMRDLLDF